MTEIQNGISVKVVIHSLLVRGFMAFSLPVFVFLAAYLWHKGGLEREDVLVMALFCLAGGAVMGLFHLVIRDVRSALNVKKP